MAVLMARIFGACVFVFAAAVIGLALVVWRRGRRAGYGQCFCLWRFAIVYDPQLDSPWPGEFMELPCGDPVEGEPCKA